MIEQAIILTQIIFIDIILAADNAIIIGLIAANFVPRNRKKIIFWGVVGALVFKIIFAVFATYLFKFYFIKILGGLLLVWIVNDLRKDLFEIQKIKSPKKKSMEPSFIKSIYKVLFADITISFVREFKQELFNVSRDTGGLESTALQGVKGNMCFL